MCADVVDPFRKHREFTTVVTFLPIGNAPRIEQKYSISGTAMFSELYGYIRQAAQADDVHMYVNNQFEPMEDQAIGDIAKLFAKKHVQSQETSYNLSVYYSIGRAYV